MVFVRRKHKCARTFLVEKLQSAIAVADVSLAGATN